MDLTWLVFVACMGASMIIATLGVMFVMIVKVFKGASSGSTSAGDEDETRMIQEIYHGLTKMEDRIETLETLLVDSEARRSERKRLSDFDRNMERGQES
jgi:phage shock protein B